MIEKNVLTARPRGAFVRSSRRLARVSIGPSSPISRESSRTENRTVVRRDPRRIFLFFSDATRSPTGLLQNLRSDPEHPRTHTCTCVHVYLHAWKQPRTGDPVSRKTAKGGPGGQDETGTSEEGRGGARFETRRRRKRGPTAIRLEKRAFPLPANSPRRSRFPRISFAFSKSLLPAVDSTERRSPPSFPKRLYKFVGRIIFKSSVI